MDYESFKAESARLYADLESADAKMAQFPKRPDGGTPENVRITPRFQEARAEYQKAFDAVRRFNGLYVRQFKKEIAADRKFK